MRRFQLACLVLLIAAARQAHAQTVLPLGESVHYSGVWHTHDDVRKLEKRHAQAGYPLKIAPWARFTYDSKYKGYYVGGGTPPTRFALRRHPVDPRFLGDGTWGMDYAPWYSHVELLWTHGRRYQGGEGQYEPDRRNWPFGLHTPPAE